MTASVREEAFVVGGEAPLVGTLTRAAGGRPPSGTAMILLNAGLVGRAGPDGLNAQLARACAARGVPALRFDYSGVGDSPPRRDRLPLHEGRIRETSAAVDAMEEETGADSFVLMGICTGADNAFQTALSDPRVQGLVLLDGYPYRTAGWWIRHYGSRLFRASSWKTLLTSGPAPAGPDEVPEGSWDGVARRIPSRTEMARQLRTLIERETDMYFIYTGGFRDWVNYAGQLAAAFRRVPFRGRVRVDYLPGADHVFRAEASRRILAERVLAWVEARGRAL